MNNEVGNGISVLLVLIAFLANATLQMNASALLNNVCSFVRRGMKVGLPSESNVVTSHVGERPDLACGLLCFAADMLVPSHSLALTRGYEISQSLPVEVLSSPDFEFDRSRIEAAFASCHEALNTDPALRLSPDDLGIRLKEFKPRLAAVPPTGCTGEQFYAWLDGAEDYRYAGARILYESIATPAARIIESDAVIDESGFVIVGGDLHIRGTLTAREQSLLFVLGDLTIDGDLIGEASYHAIAAKNIRVGQVASAGELLAWESIEARGLVYLFNNDYACRAPLFRGPVLVDFERGNSFARIECPKRIGPGQWDFDLAAKALGFEGCNDEDLPNRFIAKLQSADEQNGRDQATQAP